MRKKPDKRTIEEMILDAQPTMRTGADRNIRSAVQQTYRELGVSADNLSMTGFKESPEQLETGEKQYETGARQGHGWRRYAGFAAAMAAVVGIFAVTVAVMGGRLGGNRGGVTKEKNPESNIPVYLLTEIGYPSYSEKERLIYPKEGREWQELIMDWPGEYIVDSNCDFYDYKVMEKYRKTLEENGYTIIQGDPADIEKYRRSHYKEYPEGYASLEYSIRETQGVYDGKQEWAAYKDGMLIVVEIPFSVARVYTYVSCETPFGGYTPEKAMDILMNPETRVDLFPKANGGTKESCTPNVIINPIDVTPNGMYERTQAQVFLTLLMRDGILYRRFFILRDGIAYEWLAGNVAFADINGDGETEICMIQRNIQTDESKLPVWGTEKFYAFERPKEDGVPRIKTMTLDSASFREVVREESSGGVLIGINYCSLGCEGTTVTVHGRDKRMYRLYMTDSLYLSDCETDERVRQSPK